MKQRHLLTILAAFLLTPALAPAQQASLKPSDAAAQHDERAEPGHKENISTSVSRRPVFSWDHVPL
ncbi:MAG: hypothetical protein HQ515_04085, partial [Phycisphaeraceae bacterium]|nr:hypothetical protein [Phycisphaeraceae bacterium]